MSYDDAPVSTRTRPRTSPRVASEPRVSLHPRSRRYPAYVYWRRRAIVVAAIFTLSVVTYYGTTLGFALNNPAYGVTFQARFAEWGRQHGLGGLVVWAETEYNKMHPAKVGGNPNKNTVPTVPTVKISSGTQPLAVPAALKTPAAGAPLVENGWREGTWKPAGRLTANGLPAVYETFIRPDAVHTSYVVGVAWMDTKILSGALYSGSQIPGGGPYPLTAPISPDASKTLVAAFNAGFRMQDANGGYYTNGKTIIPLRVGAASVVVYADGNMNVGQWGSDLSMAPDASGSPVVSVRQNLDLIVNRGRPAAGLDVQNNAKWGKSAISGTFNVFRSGLGITRDGALVYVGGPGMSISDVADTLVRAGAVRGLELDMNTDWVQYTTYAGPVGQVLNGSTGADLLPYPSVMDGSPQRFFATWWTRDFFVMSLRPKYQSTASAG